MPSATAPPTLKAQLLALGFSQQQVRQAAKVYNIKGVYQALVDYTPLLLGIGFDFEQMVKFAKNHGGAQTLAALGRYGAKLVQAGDDQAALARAAALPGRWQPWTRTAPSLCREDMTTQPRAGGGQWTRHPGLDIFGDAWRPAFADRL